MTDMQVIEGWFWLSIHLGWEGLKLLWGFAHSGLLTNLLLMFVIARLGYVAVAVQSVRDWTWKTWLGLDLIVKSTEEIAGSSTVETELREIRQLLHDILMSLPVSDQALKRPQSK